MIRICLPLFIITITAGCQPSQKQIELNLKKGEALFTKYGCFSCHSLKGEKLYGPSLNNILGKEIVVIRQGKTATVKVDRNYLKKSILNPEYEKVKDFAKRKMPVPAISDNTDVDLLINYIENINHVKR